MRVLLIAGILIVAVLAGCSSPPPATPPSPPPARTLPPGVAVFHNATTPLDIVPDVIGVASSVGLNHSGAEPNIGITSDGSIFVSSFSSVMRSRDNGTTWKSVQEHNVPVAHDVLPTGDNNDPMLWVDTETDRVYNAPMFPVLLCSTFYWSDDHGDTWAGPTTVGCGSGPYDHQKLATGKPGPDPNPAAGVRWPTVTYMCYNAIATTNCAVSYDGGQTWPVNKGTEANAQSPPGVPEGTPSPTTGCSSGQNGHPTAAPDGAIVFARTGPGCPQPFLTESRDSGLTWSIVPGPVSPNPTSLDPEVAFSTNGTLYMLFQDAKFHEILARSHDMGKTWDGTWDVMPPGVKTASFSALAAGSDGRVAMAFLGTTDAKSKGSPTNAKATAKWNMYIVTSEDANTAQPTFVSYIANPDPVQRGPIWQGGGGDSSRNLLDFIDGAIAPDGTFYVAYADGCTSAKCISDKGKPEDSRDSMTTVAHLAGWSLFDAGVKRPGKSA